jgi:hypothetical protein
MRIFDGLIDRTELILEVFNSLLCFFVIVGLLLLLLLFALLDLLTLLSSLLLNRLSELNVDWNLIKLPEIARNWDLNDRGIVL